MFLKITAGQTQRTIPVRIQDSSSTTGALLSGLLWNTSGLTARWRREGDSTHTTLTLSNATLGSWTDGGFIADSIAPGHYEIGLPNSMIAAGAKWAELVLYGAANMAPLAILIELDVVNYQTDAFGALKPTTSGRTLDVSTGGEAGIDLANIGSPTTVVNLSGLTIKTATDIETDTQDIQTRLPAALLGGRMDVSVGAYQSGLVPLQPTVAGRTLDVSAGGEAGIDLANVGSPTAVVNLSGLTIKTATDVEADTQDIQTRLPAALVSGRMDASVGAYQTGLTPVTAAQIWDEILTGATHNINHSSGKLLRQLFETVVLLDGDCQAASNAGTSSTGTITLAAGTTTACVGQAIRCDNQVRFIVSFNPSTLVAELDRPWCVVPTAPAAYTIFNVRNPLVGLKSLYVADSFGSVIYQLGTMLEADGAGGFQLTTLSLENAPTGGGGGGTDWTTNEKAAIRGILGFDSSGNLVVPSSGALYTITTQTASLFKYGDTQRWNSPANQIDVIITKVP
jgi:hypothetical protein